MTPASESVTQLGAEASARLPSPTLGRGHGGSERRRYAARVSLAARDAELVAVISAGDRDALAALYDRYAGILFGLSRRLLSDSRDAEDLLHDVFIEVWKQAKDYDSMRGSVRAWLFTRVRARALDRIRAQRVRRALAVEAVAGSDAPDEFALDRAKVRRALQALPPEQCEVLELAYFSGLSSTEISAQLGIPVGTVDRARAPRRG